MAATQSIHDQELTQLGIELHRRDNLVNDLQEAKTLLENSLAKHLQEDDVALTYSIHLSMLTQSFVGQEQA